METTIVASAAARQADTFPKLLLRNARERGARVAFRHKDLGIWQSWTWAEVAEQIRAYARGLEQLGLKRGEKVAIIGYNRPRLYWSMAAAQWLGAIPVPVATNRKSCSLGAAGRMKLLPFGPVTCTLSPTRRSQM